MPRRLRVRGCFGGVSQKVRTERWWLCVPEIETLRTVRTIEGVAVFSRVEVSGLLERGCALCFRLAVFL